ncbi:MAG: lasso RiPP family leader peptide-containing protein [Actinomycetota bacterium]
MKSYSTPILMRYGRIEELTLGTGGAKPDLVFSNGNLVDTNTDCSDPSTNTTACLIVS